MEIKDFFLLFRIGNTILFDIVCFLLFTAEITFFGFNSLNLKTQVVTHRSHILIAIFGEFKDRTIRTGIVNVLVLITRQLFIKGKGPTTAKETVNTSSFRIIEASNFEFIIHITNRYIGPIQIKITRVNINGFKTKLTVEATSHQKHVNIFFDIIC